MHMLAIFHPPPEVCTILEVSLNRCIRYSDSQASREGKFICCCRDRPQVVGSLAIVDKLGVDLNIPMLAEVIVEGVSHD